MSSTLNVTNEESSPSSSGDLQSTFSENDAFLLQINAANDVEKWQNSPCRASLKAQLEHHAPSSGWNLTQFILLGVGNIGCFDDPENEPYLMITQMVVFKDIANLVGASRCETKPQLFAQDPAFTAADKEALRFCGFDILESPEAEKRIDGITLVVAPFTPVDHKILGVTKSRQPAILVGLSFPSVVRNAAKAVHVAKRKLEITTEAAGRVAGKRAVERELHTQRRALRTERTFERFQLGGGEDCEFSFRNRRPYHHFESLWVHIKKR